MSPETLLRDMIVDTMDFETDEEINGADFIEWFAVFREKAVAVLKQAKPKTLRDEFAMAELTGLLANVAYANIDHEIRALNAYQMANAMMKVR